MTWATTITALSPSSWYKLNEASGNWADSGSGGITATVTATVTYSVAGLVYNDADTSVTLDGIAAKGSLGDNYDFPTNTAFTIIAIISPTGVAANQVIVDKSNATDGWGFVLASTSNLTVRRRSAAGANIDTLTGIATLTATRMIVAATYDGATMALYLNGLNDGSLASSRALPGNALNAMIGARPAASEFFGGTMDEVIIFSGTAQSAAVIFDLAQEAGYAPLNRSYRMPAMLPNWGRMRERHHLHIARIATDNSTIRQVPSYLLTAPGFNLTPGHVDMPPFLKQAWERRPATANKGMDEEIMFQKLKRDLYLPAGSGQITPLDPAGSGEYTGPN